MKKNYLFTFSYLLFVVVLSACDPVYSGKKIIANETDEILYFIERYYEPDSIIIIAPQTETEIQNFGGMGYGFYYNCCACNFDTTITLYTEDTTKSLTKDIFDDDEWELDNPNTHKRDNKEIICTFRVTSSDIE